jgi:hypothetical protein
VRTGLIALALLAASGMLPTAAGAGAYALAQRAEAQLGIASTILAEPATQIPLAIQVGPPDALPANSFLRLRGLPPSVSLSDGHAIGPAPGPYPVRGGDVEGQYPRRRFGPSELI